MTGAPTSASSSALAVVKGPWNLLSSSTSGELDKLLGLDTRMGSCVMGKAVLPGSCSAIVTSAGAASGGGLLKSDPEELLDDLLDYRDELASLVRRLEPR